MSNILLIYRDFAALFLDTFFFFFFIFKWVNFERTCLFFRGFTGGGKAEEQKQEKDDVINIFSVASGHLYERFLRWV